MVEWGEFKKLPNIITGIRLLIIPFLAYFAWQRNETAFIGLFILERCLDYLDGYVARRYGLASEFGAKLDGFVDELFGTLNILFIYLLRPYLIMEYMYPIIIVLGLNMAKLGILFAKFGGKTKLHLYSGRVLGGMTFLAAVGIFLFRADWMLVLVLAAIIVNVAEEIILLLTRKGISHNITGIAFTARDYGGLTI